MTLELSRLSVTADEALAYRRKYRGLIGVQSKVPVKDKAVLSQIYTPGVAEPCLRIQKDPALSFPLTCRGNTIAIVSNGSAMYGLGNLGPEAALPALEGKAVMAKTFAGVDALPICIDADTADEFVDTVLALEPTFGAICLEDLAVPAALEIRDRLEEAMDIPVVNNHQTPVASGALAGLWNALKVVGKTLENVRVVVNGAGAAGIGITDMLLEAGVGEVVVCDRAGAIYTGRPKDMNWAKAAIARRTNPERRTGSLEDVLVGADVFIGFSAGNVVTPEMVRSMAPDPIIFAFAVPEPEIRPEAAKAAGAAVVATGRSDYPNEMNIGLIFPGLFRGLLDVGAHNVDNSIAFAAAEALASLVGPDELNPDYITPSVLDFRNAPTVAAAVARQAIANNDARWDRDPDEIARWTRQYVYEGQAAVVPPPDPHFNEMSLGEQAIDLRRRYRGSLEIRAKLAIKDQYTLSMYLPPIDAVPAQVIRDNPDAVYDYTAKGNLVAIVTDGSAVLGLGNIGGGAGLPVMEGKAVLFNTFAGVEAFPICVTTQDPDEIVNIVTRIAPTFGGVNLEDISAPRCFEIERRLKETLDIPIFHDDQHGTAVVVLAGLLNALKLTGRKIDEIRVVMNGAGASAVAVAKILLSAGVPDIVMCDSKGIIYEGRKVGMNWMKNEMAKVTNREKLKGGLADAMKGRDVLIGLSVANCVTEDMVRTMAENPIIFALANPVPEIMPDKAYAGGAATVATGRSDLPNQVNNSLAFPAIFRGALDTRAREINEEMKIAAAHAIANFIRDDELERDYIIPAGMDFRVPPAVAAAVAQAAMDSGVARIKVNPDDVAERTRRFIYEGFLD
ncbi:MAG: NADP-dependent malic enzyme [Chloroflexi bacterium]|nr:MAG: NADP-dependent malic enzyme [Chloroflexota bacterium]